MRNDLYRRRIMWRGGAASVALHGMILAVFLVSVPVDPSAPPAEESVRVEIVPPPEPEAVDEAKPAEKAPSPQEAKENPAPAAAPPAAPAPPPPAPPSQASEPAPQPPEPAAKPAEDAAAPTEPPAPARALEAFRPVSQFAEKDSGPRKAEDGSAAEEAEAGEQNAPASTPVAQAGTDEGPISDGAGAGARGKAETTVTGEDPQPPADATAGEAASAQASQPSALAGGFEPMHVLAAPMTDRENKGGSRDSMEAADAGEGPSGPTAPKAGGTAGAASARPKPALRKASKLFSATASSDPFAAVAMGTMSRSDRAAQLCNTELREQLARGRPAYQAEALPKPALRSGNTIDARAVGFFARQRWFEVSFRCEVDPDARKVVAFAHHVGGEIPRSEWRRRGFPVY